MRKILLTLLCVVALGALVACGDSNFGNRTPVPTPPSNGNNAGFSNASLKGTYVFAANGITPSSLFAVVGQFSADGNGIITAGTRDTVNDIGGQTLNEPITGTYSIDQDGRGQAVLNGSFGQVIYRFVLRGTGEGTLFQISNSNDATGRILPLPNPLPPVVNVPVTYIVRLDGEDRLRNTYGAVGALTFSATGNAVNGILDENDNGTFNAQLTATGSYTPGSSRGTVTFSANGVSHNFVFYPVAQNRIELVSTDKSFFLHGYGYAQSSPATSADTFKGDQVFNIFGFDSAGSILETGRFTLDGAGNITNAIEDYNEAGTYFDGVGFGGTYAVAANGRWTATLNYSTSALSMVGWQVSPQMSLLLITGSNIANFEIVETGTMRAQTIGLTTASISGNYAEHLSGTLAGNGSVESAGNFDADGGGNLTGTIDSQTPTSINTDISQSGNYSVAATNGRSSGVIGAIPVHLYTVDANTIYLISTDPVRQYQGMMLKQ